MSIIRVKWVADGSNIKDKTRTTVVDTGKFMPEEDWKSLHPEDKRVFIKSVVREDFEESISFKINNYGL